MVGAELDLHNMTTRNRSNRIAEFIADAQSRIAGIGQNHTWQGFALRERTDVKAHDATGFARSPSGAGIHNV